MGSFLIIWRNIFFCFRLWYHCWISLVKRISTGNGEIGCGFRINWSFAEFLIEQKESFSSVLYTAFMPVRSVCSLCMCFFREFFAKTLLRHTGGARRCKVAGILLRRICESQTSSSPEINRLRHWVLVKRMELKEHNDVVKKSMLCLACHSFEFAFPT